LLDFLQVIITAKLLLALFTVKPPQTWHTLAECRAGAHWSCRKKNPIFDTVDMVGFINEYTDPKYTE